MKKHFLLLLLMTLLPLAGWATDYDVQVTTFNGTATWTGTKPAVQPGWFTAVPTSGTLSNEQKNFIASKLQVKDITENPNYDAGSWNYQLELSGDQVVSDDDNTYTIYVNSSTTATLTITKWETAPVFNLGELAYVTDVLAYNPTSEGQTLLSGGATATSNGTTVPVIYTLDPNAETVVKFNNFADVKATDAGNYTVYYKVAETDNYVGSDWTPINDGGDPIVKNIAKIDNEITTLTLAGWTYDPEKTAAPVVGEGDADIHIAATYGAADATFTYAKKTNDIWGEFGDYATVVGGHAGKYKVKATIAASTNYNAVEAEEEFTIAKATPVLNVDGVINTAWNLYDGENHNLFLKRATATIGETTLGNTAIYYNARYKAPGGDYGSWFTAKPNPTNSNFTNKKNAGTYQVQIWVEETDDYNAVYHKPNNHFVKIDVAQADITGFTDPVAKTGLRVKGDNEAQDLVTEASWGENDPLGTFQYKVNEADWSTVAKGTAAGTYSVNFQIVPTDAVNYKTYTIAEPLSVTIAPKSTVTIATKADQTFGYGTTPVIENTVNWSADHANVDFSTSETKQLKWKWYAGTDAECTGSPVDADAHGYYPVGSYYVKGYNAELTGDDADYWEIAYTPALVKITAGQVKASISATATYGSLPTFTLTHVSGLSDTEAATFNAANNLATVTVKQGTTTVLDGVSKNADELKTLNAGTYTLEATASCDDNYVVVVSAGTLTVNPNAEYVFTIEDIAPVTYKAAKWEPEVTVTGLTVGTDYTVSYGDDTHDNIKAGEGIVKIAGVGNYEGATGSKIFTINKADLTITADNFTGDDAWIYGKDEPTYTATVDGLKGNDALKIGEKLDGIEGTLKVKRTSNETVGMHTGALVAGFYDADDNKIAAPEATNYNLNFVAGDLQVAKGAVVIQLKEAVTATYGDDPATSIDAAIKNIANYEYVSGLSELEAANFASFIDVAAATFVLTETKPQVGNPYTFTIDGATSTNYGVTINPGTYNVTAADITLYAKDQTINWATDPTATPNTTVSDATVAIVAGGLKYTDALTDVVASIDIASQNVGDNKISLTAAENANYNIIVNKDADNNDKFGNLAVTGAATLAMTSDYDEDDDWFSTIQSYDGKPVTVNLTVDRTQTLASGKTYTWKGEEWNAFILPFDITPKELSEAFGYAIVNVVDPAATSGNNVAFKLQMSGTISANTPFMLKNYEAVARGAVINFGTKIIKAPANAEVSVDANTTGDIKFIGSYNKKTIDKTNSNLYYYNGEGAWKHLGATSTNKWNIAPFNAYIETPAATDGSAPEFTFTFEDIDGSTTAIRSISEDATGTNAKGWYDLKGMKMENAPTQKGIYIKDGKKVVIK